MWSPIRQATPRALAQSPPHENLSQMNPIHQKNPALTTNEKSPSVIIVIGNAISKIIGLTTAFKIPKNAATSIAVPNASDAIVIPGINEGSTRITKATSTNVAIIFIPLEALHALSRLLH